MKVIHAKKLLVIPLFALPIAGYYVFGTNTDSQTEQVVQKFESVEEPEQAKVDEISTTEELFAQSPENNTVARVEDNIDGSHIENPEPIRPGTPLSENESAVDFKMMNPGLMNAAAMDDLEEIKVVANPVNWSEAREHAQLPESLLSENQSSIIEQSNIPVFLPPNEPLLKSANLNVGDTWFAASMGLPEVNVVVEGSNATMKGQAEQPGENIGRLGSYSVGRSLGMAEVVLFEFGVFYTITVECADLNNQACTEDMFISEIVDNLLLANTQGVEDGA